MASRNTPAGQGVVTKPSPHSVAMLARLRSALEQRGVKLFTVIDHSGEAARAGQQLPNTKRAVFDNPAAGTP